MIVLNWIVRKWNRRRRDIDVAILWPCCKEHAPDLDTARVAFAMHAHHDPAWRELSEADIIAMIEALA